MKKKMLRILTAGLTAMLLLNGCGKKDDTQNETPNISGEENSGSEESDAANGDLTDSTEQGNNEADTSGEETENTENGVDTSARFTQERDLALEFYQYGMPVASESLHVTEETFQIQDESGSTADYPYFLLSQNLIALYENTTDSYLVCYYKIDEATDTMTLNELGATAQTMVGTFDVYYVDQGAHATITFTLEATAIEDNQVDAAGREMANPYEFHYCWFADDAFSMFLCVCLDNGYFAYSAELSEDGSTLNLTEAGAYLYDL